MAKEAPVSIACIFSAGFEMLSCSWSALLEEGRAKVPDLCGILGGPDLKVEVMKEMLLRVLTREICLLLSVLGSPGLNFGLHSEQLSTDSDVLSSTVVGKCRARYKFSNEVREVLALFLYYLSWLCY